MSTITDCLIASLDIAATIAKTKVLASEPITAGGFLTAGVLHGFREIAAATSLGVSAAVAASFRVDLLAGNYTVHVIALPKVRANQFVVVAMIGGSTLFSRIADLVAVGYDITGAKTAAPLRTLVSAAPLTGAAANVGGLRVKQLATAALVVDARIVLRVFDLVGAPALTLATAIPPTQRVRSAPAGVTMALTASALQAARLFQVASAAYTVAATPRQILHAYQVATASAVISAAPLDTLPVTGEAWTAPTDAFAMSHYGFAVPHNSQAVVNGYLVSYAKTGAFRRFGVGDEGRGFDVFVKTGMTDFNDEYLKRFNALYVAYTASENVNLILGVTRSVAGSGTEQSWSYTLPVRVVPASGISAGRFKPGRGIETRYVRATIGNVDGGTLTLRGAKFDYDKLKKRV